MRSIYSLKYLTIFGLDDDDGCLWQQLPWGRCWQAAEQKPRLAASLHSWIFVICAPRTRLLGKLLLHTKVRRTQQNQSMANIMYALERNPVHCSARLLRMSSLLAPLSERCSSCGSVFFCYDNALLSLKIPMIMPSLASKSHPTYSFQYPQQQSSQ